ncbi:LysR family transcriptional regulator [Frigidibacter sp. RF13]|uniref:LysR family transcriptional regulator n=1 Tax=Frigidibacter sp. RF13 TaxID=2997340 RepID=UPI0022704CD0|nr:LysR family transcriptional regulator [Frigidibacter sp. RF13]MCY1127392.1 LysR family transcriptional regulator [Frigidibacter sp. RF13]
MNSAFRDWSNIRFFLAVCRTGSTLAAARELGSAQPTVARRIEALEHELGLVLFDKDTRGFHPTHAARALLPEAQAIEAAVQRLSGKAADLTGNRVIRLTAPKGNFSPRLHRIVHEFSERYPGLELKFLPSNDVLDLMAGDADIALRMIVQPPDKRLIRRKISTARYSIYGSQAYARKHGLPSSQADLVDHSFVAYRPGNEVRRAEQWLLRTELNVRFVRYYGEYDLLHEAVAEGVGLGILNDRASANDARLMACFGPIPELDQDHLLLVSPTSYRRPEVRQFVKFFAPRYAAGFN